MPQERQTVVLMGVEHPLLNKGFPTLIPLLNAETNALMEPDVAIQLAVKMAQRGVQFPAFPTNDLATLAAQLNSKMTANELKLGIEPPPTTEGRVRKVNQRLGHLQFSGWLPEPQE